MGLGETCGGFDETINGPFPDCEDGLECLDAGLITIPGAGNTCQQPAPKVAGFGETCRGFNEKTSLPFPECDEGFVCLFKGGFSIPG